MRRIVSILPNYLFTNSRILLLIGVIGYYIPGYLDLISVTVFTFMVNLSSHVFFVAMDMRLSIPTLRKKTKFDINM